MPIIETSVLALLIWAVLGYLFGSVPFGVLISRLMGLGNVRDIGSGNIGATNVLRTGSKPAAFATLVLDGAKGAIAALIARAVAGEDAAQVAGLMALIGHCYPIWLKFNGGKGVATFLGLLLALSLPVGTACCATWVAFAALKRISSLAALAAAGTSTFWMTLLGYSEGFVMGVILTTLIFWRHRSNITRLRAGTEPKIGA
ncbi:MAG: glycerol-3-phosphate 1-O-acyltransferase PlsY [Planktotalea sp.]|uniref:glycerol-3-phosphate 1-O-acyltransferase PlsY n=1 Tax=Planktotalea sp. TaxID=2029877 RepID=UPI002631D1B9|nr:glycerol-3-phosphate 1-O-acyltransferase PlsY [Planktotalea sp.]MDG1084281.1 glycerol-3-phosphate 1-O-acyltransferase PlsY [Planktotalea sp.]